NRSTASSINSSCEELSLIFSELTRRVRRGLTILKRSCSMWSGSICIRRSTRWSCAWTRHPGAPNTGHRPREGLLARYLDVFGPTTDAPYQYHVFSAFALMASLLGRRVWVRDGAGKLYPNLFVLLLGPSSLYRK